MLDELFAESVIHRRASFFCRAKWSGHVVAGLRLRPFSYWHAFQLDAINNPFAGHGDGSTPPTFPDLTWAIAACRLRYPRLPALGRITRWRAEWAYLRAKRRHEWLANQNLAFLAYLADYNSRPRYGDPKADDELIKTPWYLYEIASLMNYFPRLTLAQAWDTPVGYGAWLIAARTEAAGNKVDLLTPELREAFAKVGVQI